MQPDSDPVDDRTYMGFGVRGNSVQSVEGLVDGGEVTFARCDVDDTVLHLSYRDSSVMCEVRHDCGDLTLRRVVCAEHVVKTLDDTTRDVRGDDRQ